ncbi:MAG TPA: hypothetical protein VF491_07330, partial [Vicinamibacterales bacterium]
MAIVVLLGWFLVNRPGWSPDEEITVFAVRGILSTGVPAMPSGWVYWRGAAYSYLSASAAAVAGDTLPTYRAIALAAAVASVIGISVVAQRVVGYGAAAALLLAIWPLTASLSGYARFYAPFVAVYVGALLAFSQVERRRSALWWFVIAAVVARALQEFAISLLLIPLAAVLSAEIAEQRRRYLTCAVVAAACVGGIHILLTLPQSPAGAAVSHWGFNRFALPATTVSSLPALTLVGPLDLMLLFALFTSVAIALHRTVGADALFIVAAAGAAALFALGTIVAIVVTATLLRPARAARTAAASLALLILAAVVWIAVISWRTDIAMSPAFAVDLLAASFRFPFSAARQLTLALPVLAATTAGGVGWVMWSWRRPDGTTVVARALACALWLHIIAVGIFEIDLRVRHLAMLTPLIAVFAGIALSTIVSSAFRAQRTIAGIAALVLCGGVVAAMVVEQRRFALDQIERAQQAWWGTWSPPIAQSTFDARQAPSLDAADIVISNDELASLLRIGRVDYWLAPAPAAELLTYETSDGAHRGAYGAAELISADALASVIAARASHSVSLVVFHTGKFGIDEADSKTIAELTGGQRRETVDWTHI